MSDITTIGLIILAAVVLFVWNRLPVVVVAMATGLSLWATGILSLNQALSGYGDPAVIFIASLFVVSAALEQTGITVWAGQKLIAGAGEDNRTRLMVLMALLVAALTALISVNGAVAALLPVVVVMAVRLRRPTSQLLMPLVFSAHAGSMLALTGTPVNVLISDAAEDAGVGHFGFFEFTLAGIPLVLGTVAIIVLLGEKLLPVRNGEAMPRDFSRHARTLVEQYGLTDGLFRLRLREGSDLIGASTEALDFSEFAGLQFAGAQDGNNGLPLRAGVLSDGDYLLLRGDAGTAGGYAAKHNLSFREEGGGAVGETTLFNSNLGLAEVMIPPRSALIGRNVFPGMVTDSGDLMILAVQRNGVSVDEGPAAPLRAGDTLLLQGTWRALDVNLTDPEVLVVNSPEVVRRQAVALGAGAKQTIAIMAVMVILLATGIVPAAVAGLLAAGAIVLTGILTIDQCYRAIGWTTVILVGAMMPLSTAMEETGAARMMAEGLVSWVGDSSPRVLLGGLFLLTAILGQLISNTATALIVIPISVAAAHSLGISPEPVLMSVGVAAAAAFLTPIATPTNLMVMGPGGYAFGDYWKFGLPMMIWFFIVSVFYVPLIWRF